MPLPLVAAAEIARAQGRRPFVTTVTAGRWHLETWRESHRGWLPDLAAVESCGGSVRLVVADPAENAQLADKAARSARAVAAVWDHARRVDDPATALRTASAAVCDPGLRPRHRNPLCAAVIVDLDPTTPQLTGGARAGDGDLWARTEGEFAALTGADMLTCDGRARITDAFATTANGPERWAAQEDVLDDPGMWNHHVIGLVADPTIETFTARDTTDVVLTTDGSRLEPHLEPAGEVEHLGEWLAVGITDVGDNWPHEHPFGDLAVIRARWFG